MPQARRWTPEEDGIVCRDYAETSIQHLATRLGRSRSSVKSRILHLDIRRTEAWTTEQEEYIRTNFQNKSDGELAVDLDRSLRAVEGKRLRLGLDREGLRRWTPEEDQAIRDAFARAQRVEYGAGILGDLAVSFGRNFSVVSERAKELGCGFRAAYKRKSFRRKYRRVSNAAGILVFEHIAVVEGRIGRKLQPAERVHHVNGIKSDNRNENLYLCASASEHHRIHHQSFEIIAELMERGIVSFNHDSGRYEICKGAD